MGAPAGRRAEVVRVVAPEPGVGRRPRLGGRLPVQRRFVVGPAVGVVRTGAVAARPGRRRRVHPDRRGRRRRPPRRRRPLDPGPVPDGTRAPSQAPPEAPSQGGETTIVNVLPLQSMDGVLVLTLASTSSRTVDHFDASRDGKTY